VSIFNVNHFLYHFCCLLKYHISHIVCLNASSLISIPLISLLDRYNIALISLWCALISLFYLSYMSLLYHLSNYIKICISYPKRTILSLHEGGGRTLAISSCPLLSRSYIALIPLLYIPLIIIALMYGVGMVGAHVCSIIVIFHHNAKPDTFIFVFFFTSLLAQLIKVLHLILYLILCISSLRVDWTYFHRDWSTLLARYRSFISYIISNFLLLYPIHL